MPILDFLATTWKAWVCLTTHKADHQLRWRSVAAPAAPDSSITPTTVLYVHCTAPGCGLTSSGILIGDTPLHYVRPFRPPWWWLKCETGLRKAYAWRESKGELELRIATVEPIALTLGERVDWAKVWQAEETKS